MARLRAAASLLPKRGRIADVGAGDGALSLLLAAEAEHVQVIATEAASGPYARLAAACRGEARIALRFGSGLSPLRGERLDAIAVLGMGASTILQILEGAAEHPGTLFVLGPMQHTPVLRRGLRERSLAIVDERLAVEGERVYELIAARIAPSPPLSWLDQQLGPVVRRTHPPGFARLCEQRLRLLRARLRGAKGSLHLELEGHIRAIEEEYDGPRDA
ncbi:MAG: tRNA (adenine(22)-N(1))-methyltransferase TrmK [Thermaerobacter sp.]|nr:tRNA (adenine(22)-N(1))-methyltransferase TrmK [Thermaerobacter sp.]